MIGMVTGLLLSRSDTVNEFDQLKPKILTGVEKLSRVDRESFVACTLSRAPPLSIYRNANGPMLFTFSCWVFVTLSDGVQSSHFAIPIVGVDMLKFGKFWVTSFLPGYCVRSPPIANVAGPNCSW